jgi:hypothetical protein
MAERHLLEWLQDEGCDVKTHVTFDWCEELLPGNDYFDFAVGRVLIELDTTPGPGPEVVPNRMRIRPFKEWYFHSKEIVAHLHGYSAVRFTCEDVLTGKAWPVLKSIITPQNSTN